MGDYRDKLAKKASELLVPGEQLLAGARLVRSVIGAMIVERTAGDDGPKGLLAGNLELPKQVAIGLTDRRVIFWSRSMLTGGANKMVGELAHDQVARIDYDNGALMGKLDITLVDGRRAAEHRCG